MALPGVGWGGEGAGPKAARGARKAPRDPRNLIDPLSQREPRTLWSGSIAIRIWGRGAGGMSVRTGSGECDWRWAVTVTGLVAAAFARPASQLCSPRRRPCPAPCPVPSPTHVLSGLPPHQPLPAVSASCRRASCPAPSRALSQRLETRVRPSPAFFSPEPFPFSPGPRQLTSSLRPTAPTSDPGK